MQEIWFYGTNVNQEEARDKIRQDVALAHNAFKRLLVILNDKFKNSSSQDYDIAAWPFYQADLLGYNRALTEVRKLIAEAELP